MADGNFGGNGSVQWEIHADNVRRSGGGPHSEPVPPGNPKAAGHRQDGIDETPQNSRFRIRIKLPQRPAEATQFLNDLTTAAANPSGGEVVFTLPIEDQQSGYVATPKQIRIEWPV